MQKPSVPAAPSKPDMFSKIASGWYRLIEIVLVLCLAAMVFMVLLGVSVALSIQVVGALLVLALLITPAAAALMRAKDNAAALTSVRVTRASGWARAATIPPPPQPVPISTIWARSASGRRASSASMAAAKR